MSAHDVLKQVDDFHLMIDRGKSNAEVIALYKRFVLSEIKELQEAIDDLTLMALEKKSKQRLILLIYTAIVSSGFTGLGWFIGKW